MLGGIPGENTPGQEAFTVDLRLLLELGERLISKDEVALVELVKNSFDADATQVKVEIDTDSLTISDDGTGMDAERLKQGWLAIGTPVKKRATTTAKKRRVLGEKGLGRLAVMRLGSSTELVTQQIGNKCLSLTMDWSEATGPLQSGEAVPISSFKMHLEEAVQDTFPEGHGTRIRISNLRHEWGAKQVESLRVILARLVEPRSMNALDFRINLTWLGEDQSVDPPEVVSNPHYSLRVNVDADGTCNGVLRWRALGILGSEEVKGIRLERDDDDLGIAPETKCGPFEISLSAWDLDSPELRGYKMKLREWSGVSLWRNGFRVVQPNTDWLRMNLRRVQNPTLRLSTNQLIGGVSISSDENPTLVDKTDREGLVEGPSTLLLSTYCYQVFSILERKRFTIRRERRLSQKTLLSPLDTTPLKIIAKEVAGSAGEAIADYASNLDSFRSQLSEWILGRDRMATMGMLSARLIHEARGALGKINDNFPLVEPYLPTLTEPLKSRVTRMVDGAKAMNEVFSRLDPFLKYRSRRNRTLSLLETIESLIYLLGPELKSLKIASRVDVDPSLTIYANPTDLYVVFANLFDNSIYWLTHPAISAPRIEMRAIQTAEQLRIDFYDNGPGVPPEHLEDIFEFGFSLKPDGSGIGLSIVRDIIEALGGMISVDRDSEDTGARFTIVLPLEETT